MWNFLDIILFCSCGLSLRNGDGLTNVRAKSYARRSAVTDGNNPSIRRRTVNVGYISEYNYLDISINIKAIRNHCFCYTINGYIIALTNDKTGYTRIFKSKCPLFDQRTFNNYISFSYNLLTKVILVCYTIAFNSISYDRKNIFKVCFVHENNLLIFLSEIHHQQQFLCSYSQSSVLHTQHYSDHYLSHYCQPT